MAELTREQRLIAAEVEAMNTKAVGALAATDLDTAERLANEACRCNLFWKGAATCRILACKRGPIRIAVLPPS